ncbi:MAG TPA: hypothetical protein VKX39_05630 [Bryobacteraceae bacterium]|nr:hypothetical protein [Bryobacteraceae bacterium]
MIPRVIVALMATAAALLAQTVTIVNTGSTNTSGFQIAVEKSGKAQYRQRRGAPQKLEKKIPAALAKRLYKDVKAARPLPALPAPYCVKSASFGTRTYIDFGSEESPDLSCGDAGDARLRDLIRDVDEIVALFRNGSLPGE